MAQVFISYERASRPTAEKIVETLTSLGYSVWWDDLLPVHRTYTDVIDEHLKSARAVVVLWSAAAIQSEWVRAEADVARQQHKLVQAALGNTTPPLPFNQIQYTDLSGWYGDADASAWKRVIASVAELVGDPTRPATISGAAAARPLLAVLPFDNLSGDAELLYFSDGISEEILQAVSKTSGVATIGRSSTFQFRGSDKATQRVAAELRATHVLDGSVRRSGQRVRISAQLTDCSNHTMLWSDRFDRELADVFALQDEIAGAVAGALKTRFAPQQAGRIDPQAYDYFLRARSDATHWLGARDASLLERAVEGAPEFAAAWAELAFSLAVDASDTDREQPRPALELENLRARARNAASRALAIDPNAAFAHAAHAALEPICGAFAPTAQYLERALAAAPTDATILGRMSRFCRTVGFTHDAHRFIARAYELDPLRPNIVNEHAGLLADIGEVAASNETFDRARRRWPQLPYLARHSIYRAAAHGDWQRVDKLVASVNEIGPHAPGMQELPNDVARLRESQGSRGAHLVERMRMQLEQTATVSLKTFVEAASCVGGDAAYPIIERASFEHLFRPGGRLLQGDFGLQWLFGVAEEPASRIQIDPRFVVLCERFGLCEYWAGSGRMPDCAEWVAPYYDFAAEVRRSLRR